MGKDEARELAGRWMTFAWKMLCSRHGASPFEQKFVIFELKASPVTLSSGVPHRKAAHEIR